MIALFWGVVGLGIVLVGASCGLVLLAGVDSFIVGSKFFGSIRKFEAIHPVGDRNFEFFHVETVEILYKVEWHVLVEVLVVDILFIEIFMAVGCPPTLLVATFLG
jgi:hypothetical protein